MTRAVLGILTTGVGANIKIIYNIVDFYLKICYDAVSEVNLWKL